MLTSPSVPIAAAATALLEERLRDSENRAQAIIDHMLGGLIMADESYVIQSVNAAAARMFGCEREELVGKDLWRILPEFGDDADELQLSFIEPEVLGSVSEWWGQRKDGSLFPFELSLCAFHYGGQRYVAGNLRDLSELHEVERVKLELISTVNHELRTPLTSIRGSLTLLASGVLGEIPPEAGEMVALAERNCVRLLALINDILDLERLDRRQMEMSRAPVPVATLMERSRDVVRGMAEAQDITIGLHPIAGALLGDFDRLVQVLVNLLSNAIKFSPAGSAIAVSALEVQGTIEVRVRDRGRGIAAAYRDLVFERFKQVEVSDAREKGGTGLGLAICQSIVKQLGGQIGVESEEGVGSVFWFRLPAATAGEEKA
jgi:PAS domain S-box-containing protein